MADALNQRRAEALQAVDHFTDTFHGPLVHYIQAVRKLNKILSDCSKKKNYLNFLSFAD